MLSTRERINLNFVINAGRYIYCVYFASYIWLGHESLAFTELIAIVKDQSDYRYDGNPHKKNVKDFFDHCMRLKAILF